MDSIHKTIHRRLNIRGTLSNPFYAYRRGRDHLAMLFNDLGYKYGVEVGSHAGLYAECMCKANPGLRLVCVDPYTDYFHHPESQMVEAMEAAKARLASYDVSFIRKPSLGAVKEFSDDSLDFVYIDAMHDFDNVILDLIAWIPKVRRGGIVSGHDYRKRTDYGVVEAVDAYARAHDIKTYYVTCEMRDPSWLWVR